MVEAGCGGDGGLWEKLDGLDQYSLESFRGGPNFQLGGRPLGPSPHQGLPGKGGCPNLGGGP